MGGYIEFGIDPDVPQGDDPGVRVASMRVGT